MRGLALAALALLTPLSTGSPALAELAARQVSLAATGDVLLHQAVVRSAREHEAEGGWRRALGGLCQALGEGEVGLVNLETPLSESVVEPRGGDHPVLGAPPEVAAALAACGVAVASVANNHALDQNSEGLARTVAALEAAGLVAVGAGPSPAEAVRHRTLVRGGVKLAFLAASGPMNQHHRGTGAEQHVARLSDEAALLAAVAAARAEGAELVVVLLHWMWDYRAAPRRYERGLARRLIDAGADVLLGAGPHLLHPVERLPSPRGEAIVAWSLGNLISGMGMRWQPGFRAPRGMHPVSVHPGTRDAVALHLRAELDEAGRVSFPSLSADPLWTANNWMDRHQPGWRHDLRVLPLAETPEAVARARLPAIAAALGSAVTISRPPPRSSGEE